MAFRLSATEAQRVSAVLEEGIEKLLVLQTLTPDILAHRDELAEVVGEEISHIIEDQRALEMKYEQLIAARSQLKGLTNKSKFVETQQKIETVAKELRECTKALVRNLRDNPNVAENLLKIQRERDELQQLLAQTLRDLKECGYSTLHQTVEDARVKTRTLKQLQKREEDAKFDVDRLTKEIEQERLLRDKEANQREKDAASLKEELAQLRTRSKVDTAALRNQAEARLSALNRVHEVGEHESDVKLNQLQKKIEIEQIVSQENEGFLKRKYDKMQQEIQKWMQKHETDIEAKERELQNLKGVRQNDLISLKEQLEELTRLTDKYNSTINKLRDRVEQEKELQRMTVASIKIQASWRGHLVRHPPRRRRKGKGKGKKGRRRSKSPRKSKSKKPVASDTGQPSPEEAPPVMPPTSSLDVLDAPSPTPTPSNPS